MARRKKQQRTWAEYVLEIGLNLARAREATGLSQEQLAHRAGISGFTYQKFEKAESRPGTPMNPRLTTLVALSHALGVPLSELLPEDPPDPRGI